MANDNQTEDGGLRNDHQGSTIWDNYGGITSVNFQQGQIRYPNNKKRSISQRDTFLITVRPSQC